MGNSPSTPNHTRVGDITGQGSHLEDCKFYPEIGRYRCAYECTAGAYSMMPEFIPGHYLQVASSDQLICTWCRMRRETDNRCRHQCSACRIDGKEVYLHDHCFHAWHVHVKAWQQKYPRGKFTKYSELTIDLTMTK